jgi:hypothetical protein
LVKKGDIIKDEWFFKLWNNDIDIMGKKATITTVRRFIINSDIHVTIPNAAPERKERIPLSDSKTSLKNLN